MKRDPINLKKFAKLERGWLRWLIATRKPEPLLEKGFREGFAVYDAKSTGLASDLLRRLNQLDPADWGETTLVYEIQSP